MTWIVEVPNNGENRNEIVNCDVVGVAQDGSLLCFVNPMLEGQGPLAIKGYAPGCWCKFYQSSLRSAN